MNAASAATPIDIRAEGTAGKAGANRAASAAPARAIVPGISSARARYGSNPTNDDFQTESAEISNAAPTPTFLFLSQAIRWSRVSPAHQPGGKRTIASAPLTFTLPRNTSTCCGWDEQLRKARFPPFAVRVVPVTTNDIAGVALNGGEITSNCWMPRSGVQLRTTSADSDARTERRR